MQKMVVFFSDILYEDFPAADDYLNFLDKKTSRFEDYLSSANIKHLIDVDTLTFSAARARGQFGGRSYKVEFFVLGAAVDTVREKIIADHYSEDITAYSEDITAVRKVLVERSFWDNYEVEIFW